MKMGDRELQLILLLALRTLFSSPEKQTQRVGVLQAEIESVLLCFNLSQTEMTRRGEHLVSKLTKAL